MSFLENIVVDVEGALVGVMFQFLMLAKNLRITSSKTECKIAIHDYLQSGDDYSEVKKYFLDSSECDQKNLLEGLKCYSAQKQKEIERLEKDIKDQKGSCFTMFSARKTKEERLNDAKDQKFRADDLGCVLERTVENRVTPKAA